MKWKSKLIRKIISELKANADHSINILKNKSSVGIHLAVFNEPFLALIFKGEKKIESRFSINKVRPYDKIEKNDIVILKSSGGPVTGFFIAGNVSFFSNLNDIKLDEIRRKYGKQICADYDPNFWDNRSSTNYATLIEVKNVTPLLPFRIEKKDRTAWTIVQEKNNIGFLFHPENEKTESVI
jgi:hypothetical protein